MNWTLTILLFILAFLLLGCAQPDSVIHVNVSSNATPPLPIPPSGSPSATGILEGRITIGPLCPVERIPPDPACRPTAETYKAYPVGVWTPDGKTEVTLLNPALDGSYRVALSPGEYIVRADQQPSRLGGGLPEEVTIAMGATTTLDVDIDTGIR